MDAFRLIPPDEARAMERDYPDAFWSGKLSATLGIAIEAIDQQDPKRARKDLRSTLAQFIASPVPSEELRGYLRPYLERKP